MESSNVDDAGFPPLEPPAFLRKFMGPPRCECVAKLLTRISKLLVTKNNIVDEHQAQAREKECSILFVEYILDHVHCTNSECTAHHDDMLWYVPFVKASSSFYVGSGTSHLQVFRRQSRNKPVPGDGSVNWEETVCLNVILQQIDYYVTCAVCLKTSSNLQIIRKNCQRVYPSPSRRRMDAKGECEEITYPKIYFAIDDFEHVFNDIIVTEGECVCVELVARDRYNDREAVIFLGSIKYDVLKKLYDNRGSSTWNWAQKLMSTDRRRREFVRMRGPRGKGCAEMAVARVASCGFETPMSENGYDIQSRMMMDAEFANNQRRMSDTNLFNRFIWGGSKRTAMTPGANMTSSTIATPGTSTLPAPRNRRWQSDSESFAGDADLDIRSTNGDVMASSAGSSWSVKGFGQALHWLKEKKEESPLNAYLTYVTLPWANILEDMLCGSPRRPILTSDLDYIERR
uniref:C2 domain-containing protein n=1 Tax=Panagrellus redivivus TaxID=6233 RepID=A0A7E4UZK9_PANRE